MFGFVQATVLSDKRAYFNLFDNNIKCEDRIGSAVPISLLRAFALRRPDLKIRARLGWYTTSEAKHLFSVPENGEYRELRVVITNEDEKLDEISELKDFREVKKIRGFYKDSVRGFIKDKLSIIFIFAKNIPDVEYRKTHWALASIPAMCPEIEEQADIDDLEKVLLESLTQDDVSKFKEALADICEKRGFEKILTRKILSVYASNMRFNRTLALNDEINFKTKKLERLLEEIAAISDEIKNKKLCLNALMTRSDFDLDEIEGFIEASENIRLLGADEEYLKISVIDNLAYWNEDYAREVFCNDNNHLIDYMYDKLDEMPVLDKDELVALLKAIFIDETIKIRTGYGFRISTNHRCDPWSVLNYASLEMVPNPHLSEFDCLGGHELQINESLRNGDLIQAISQCAAAALNFNLEDSVVMEFFLSGVVTDAWAGFILPGGTPVLPSEAVKWLKKQKEEE